MGKKPRKSGNRFSESVIILSTFKGFLPLQLPLFWQGISQQITKVTIQATQKMLREAGIRFIHEQGIGMKIRTNV